MSGHLPRAGGFPRHHAALREFYALGTGL